MVWSRSDRHACRELLNVLVDYLLDAEIQRCVKCLAELTAGRAAKAIATAGSVQP